MAEARELELRAAEQRRHLQGSVQDLRQAIRQKLDVKKNTREHLGAASGIVFLATLAVGYSLADAAYRIRGPRVRLKSLEARM
jgi:hypothetical protein